MVLYVISVRVVPGVVWPGRERSRAAGHLGYGRAGPGMSDSPEWKVTSELPEPLEFSLELHDRELVNPLRKVVPQWIRDLRTAQILLSGHTDIQPELFLVGKDEGLELPVIENVGKEQPGEKRVADFRELNR